MFARTCILQLTFVSALAAAARLGTTALAAHSIVGQLWVVISCERRGAWLGCQLWLPPAAGGGTLVWEPGMWLAS